MSETGCIYEVLQGDILECQIFTVESQMHTSVLWSSH